MALIDILRKLVVEELGLRSCLITLNEDLADTDLAAALLKGLLHALAGTDNADV